MKSCLLLFLFVWPAFCYADYQDTWLYQCVKSSSVIGSRCLKNVAKSDDKKGMSLARCQLTCGPSNRLLWPRPESSILRDNVITFNPNSSGIVFVNANEPVSTMIQSLVSKRMERLIDSTAKNVDNEMSLRINVELKNPDYSVIRRNTDEGYSLVVNERIVNITADNYFGARHAIETLFQMMAFDDVTNEYLVLENAEVIDKPVFQHRGILVDTSRNFVTMDVLLRIIDGMAISKLNVFHWHLTDSHSFPIALEQYPEVTGKMVHFGAYDKNKVYTVADAKKLVEYANINGVRVIPEFDMPGHVGYGWQVPEFDNFTVCFGREPWNKYCLEPPCGQLNPFAEGMYEVLEKVFEEFQSIFKFDSFHLGGDEVNFNCWNTSAEVTEPMLAAGHGLESKDFVNIWSNFQQRSYEKLKAHSPKDLEAIVWTSTLTEEKNIHNLPKENYTIQIWTDGSKLEDKQIKTLAKNGYKMIFSNSDSLYLDCGLSNWVGRGSNWCSPYKGWRKIYENNLYNILSYQGIEVTEDVKKLVLGAEVTMFSEQVDSMMIEGVIFPRAAALAEQLWTNPDEDFVQAETRIILHRDRLVRHGVRAGALQPTFCLQNHESCFGDLSWRERTTTTTSTTAPTVGSKCPDGSTQD